MPYDRPDALRTRISRTELLVLAAILALAFLLRLPNLTGPDFASDDAFYAFRSIGYLDYAAATNRQSTPVTWFDTPQWWQKLSFHDAPPLVFGVEHLFLGLLGDIIFTARLPFVLAGTASILAVFLLGRLLGGTTTGLAAAAALAISNYHVWISRIGFLDGFVALWIILSLYFFIGAQERPSRYLWWGAATAAGILTKYTFLFMGPVFLILLLASQRDAWKQREFFAGLAVLLAMLAPLIIYNTMMWITRGHPDAALSTLLGMQPEDFRGLTRTSNTDLLRLGDVVRTITGQFSIGFGTLAMLSFLGAIVASVRDRERRKQYAPLLFGIASSLLMLTVIGDQHRYGVVVLPFLALFIGLGAGATWKSVNLNIKIKMALLVLAILLGAWEVVFTVQSQLLPLPQLKHPFLSASVRPGWTGYNTLDQYVASFYRQHPEPSDIIIFAAAPQLAAYQRERILARQRKQSRDAPRQKNLLVFDNRMEWMPALWIFERRRLYDGMPIHSLDQFLETVSAKGVAHYAAFGLQNAVFVIAAEKIIGGADAKGTFFHRFLAELSTSAKPIEIIRAADGGTAFLVYRIPLLNNSL